MATTRRALIFAATLTLLLSIHSADAIHIFNGGHKPRYTKSSRVSAVDVGNITPERTKALYLEWLQRKHQRAAGIKPRRIARHSANVRTNEPEIPDGFFEKIRVRNIIRDRNLKRNTKQESKTTYINKDAYLSLCHFKICNIGRKRSTRSTPSHALHHHHHQK